MSATTEAIEMARIAAVAADEKLASDVVVLDVSEQLVITDCFVIASAPNERQVNAIVENIEDRLREAGHKPVRREGTREGRWALLDFVDVVIHVQHNEERNFYALDRLWKDCPTVPVEGLGQQGPAGTNGAGAAESTGAGAAENGESER
ncbi:ribosome silencing factor [Rhodococcus sp. NPDC056960]|uniref:ribosome silencing factor n=1 Tax=Rhodococcus sp. NPDC056960 TaxID=3345982 RepID=UPI003639AB1A